MPEPFKNLFSLELIADMARHLARAHEAEGLPGFDAGAFRTAAGHELETLELKARSAQIESALTESLPRHFPDAARVLRRALAPSDGGARRGPDSDSEGLRGIALMPVAATACSRL